HQSRNKIEIRLPILHTVIAWGETAIQAELEILKSEVAKDLLNDVGNCFVLEDPAIGRARQEPQPRHHLSAIRGEPPVLCPLRQSADEAIPVTLSAFRVEDAQRDILSDKVLKVDGIVLREQIEIEMKQLGNRFGSGEAAQQQTVLTEGRRYRDTTFCL